LVLGLPVCFRLSELLILVGARSKDQIIESKS
jgi:hypothetical protein